MGEYGRKRTILERMKADDPWVKADDPWVKADDPWVKEDDPDQSGRSQGLKTDDSSGKSGRSSMK